MILIPLELLNRVVGYLGNQKYSEVAQMIDDIKTKSKYVKKPSIVKKEDGVNNQAPAGEQLPDATEGPKA